MESYVKPLNMNNVKNDLEFLVDKYSYLIKKEKNITEDGPIWLMWYQGIENAPPIVLSCFHSIIKNKNKHRVYIINKNNLKNFIKLPSYIMEKFNNGSISITHFSDIVRMALLTKYGGYWIDSTYFINAPIIKVNTTFYTLKLNSKIKWATSFLAASKNSFLVTYCFLSLLYYWKKYDHIIEYLLLDDIINVAYISSEEFKKVIDNMPLTCNAISLLKVINSTFNQSDFNCYINKLSWKRKWSILNNGTKTNYGYIIENYKFNHKYNKYIYF